MNNYQRCCVAGAMLCSFFATRTGRSQDLDVDYLQLARQSANWLDSVAMESQHGTTWPTVPGDSNNSVDSLYSGNAGVVLFYLYLYRASRDRHDLDQAIAGADFLAHRCQSIDPQENSSFWTGVAGIGYTLSLMYDETQLARFDAASQRCFEHINNHTYVIQGATRPALAWNDVTDVIGGTAGIGLYLLDRFQRKRDVAAMDLAVRAGDGLLHQAVRVGKGDTKQLKWMMSPAFPREMPNYSHGTAGICDYLVVLDAFCHERHARDKFFHYDGRFLQAAVHGANYLQTLSQSNSQPRLIPHHFPEDGPLYYLGWCHGPAGTVSFLDRLAVATNNANWTALGDQLVEQLLSCGIPEQRPPGFWNNVGVCCGNAGVASFLLDRMQVNKQGRYQKLVHALVRDMVDKSTTADLEGGTIGRYWTHAEHRVRPDFLQTQTGLMQGTAGIGLLLIKMDAAARGKPMRLELPISPF